MSRDADSVIGRYLEGDEDAFRCLMDTEARVLRARIERRMAPLLRRRVSIQDIWQEVALTVFEQRATFSGRTREEFRRWVAGIADRKLLAHVNHHAGTQKRALYREVSRGDQQHTVHAESPAPSPSQAAMTAELEVIAARALDLLPRDYREVLRLYRESGASLREIAVRMNRSHDATKKLHGRAMLQFGEHFERLRRDRGGHA